MITARRDHREGWHDPLRDTPIVIAILSVAAPTKVRGLSTTSNTAWRPQVVLIASRALEGRSGRFSAVQERNVAQSMPPSRNLQPVHSCIAEAKRCPGGTKANSHSGGEGCLSAAP